MQKEYENVKNKTKEPTIFCKVYFSLFSFLFLFWLVFRLKMRVFSVLYCFVLIKTAILIVTVFDLNAVAL